MKFFNAYIHMVDKTVNSTMEGFVMNNFQKNIVPSKNQNEKCMFWDLSKKPKILFVGNSITKHAPKPSIGWINDCGMAASEIDKDYVNIIKRKIRKKYPYASFGILQVADFEREFDTFDIEKEYSEAKEFSADLIIMFFGANVPKMYDTLISPTVTFGTRYEKLRNFLDNGTDTKFIHSQGFYIRPKLDEEKEIVAKKYGDMFVNIEDIRMLDESHGRFNHPGDYGMQLIAERFLKYIGKCL